MKTKRNRIALAALAALALSAAALLGGCGLFEETPTPAPTPTVAADPTAGALADEIDAILKDAESGLTEDAIPDDLDAPDPTGAAVDVGPLLTEAAAMWNELSTPVPTLDAGS